MHHLAPPTKSYTHLLFPHHKHIKPHKTTSQYHNTPHSNTIPTPQTPLTHHHSLHTTLPSPQHHHNTTLHNTTTHSSILIHLNSHPSSHKRLFRIPAECMCARAPKVFTKKWTNENVNPTWSTFTHRSHHITNLTNLTSITFNPS